MEAHFISIANDLQDLHIANDLQDLHMNATNLAFHDAKI